MILEGLLQHLVECSGVAKQELGIFYAIKLMKISYSSIFRVSGVLFEFSSFWDRFTHEAPLHCLWIMDNVFANIVDGNTDQLFSFFLFTF